VTEVIHSLLVQAAERFGTAPALHAPVVEKGRDKRERSNEQDQIQRRMAKQRAEKMHYCVPVL